MNKSSAGYLIILTFISSLFFAGCKKDENPNKFAKGEFPDSTMNLIDINSQYDDINTTLIGNGYLLFSSNRESSGGQFDLVQAVLSYFFDKCDGNFGIGVEMSENAFLKKLTTAANTSGDDFGPYTFFSPADGYEYLLLSSVNGSGNLDFYFLKHFPVFGDNLPAIWGPYPSKLLNTSADDAYICVDTNQDTIYFSSNTQGNYEIFLKSRPSETPFDAWFNSDYSPSLKVDSINSAGDEKCPFVIKHVMVFASNRPGGMGGFDIYYSILRRGKWSSPVNVGPDINTSSDEYRPVIASDYEFSNNMMIFSSNRPGGKGGYDLYFRGITFPK